MTIFNGKRLETKLFQLDRERMAEGWYSDVYFRNIARILTKLSKEDYEFKGQDIGNIEVEMQIFPRRQPFCILGGIDEALSILKTAAGYKNEDGNFVNTSSKLKIEACHDGEKAYYKDWDLRPEDLEIAKNYCQDVKIIATGGFNPEKIDRFESSQVPVDIYGVGSWLLSNCSCEGTKNDFTGDVVKVKIDGEWIELSKVGRSAADNPKLKKIDLKKIN